MTKSASRLANHRRPVDDRVRRAHPVDGYVPIEEGAVLLCSSWLVDDLAYRGRPDEAGVDLLRLAVG